MAQGVIGQAPTLGQILLSQGLITEQQLENGIREQQRTKVRLGQVLISSGACSEADIAGALASQLNLPMCRLDPEEVDVELVAKIGEKFLRERYCLPLKSGGSGTRIAVADPFDVETTPMQPSLAAR